ncbi:DddA-like double-stranded DNA deaminase toxin [Micromonospora sp. LOL_023]|uniref:DddA-like double-stranded DNA deaminase toxin n=1 Tax=Micromonospora sp. LOL_023 TaxID=3345418 RepID=UPI003A87AE08
MIKSDIEEQRRGRDQLVGETLRRQTTAADRLREVDQLLTAALAGLTEFAAALGVTLTGSIPAAGSAQSPTAPDIPPSAPTDVVRLGDRLAPWRQGDNVQGYAFAADRRQLDDVPFISGRIKSAGLGLRPVRGGGLPVTVTDHVEGHVAARMRAEDGPRDVTLVINKPPCDDRPFGCHQLLPHIIPAGSRLTVYVVEEGGARLHSTYHGTGKAIRR